MGLIYPLQIFITILAKTGGYKNKLISLPVWLLKFLFGVIGKQGIYQRLSDSMQVDMAFTKKQLNWVPPTTVDTAMRKCWFRVEKLPLNWRI